MGSTAIRSRCTPVASDTGAVIRPVPYGHRSFDRQWIIPDGWLINRPNPTLWETHSNRQVYMTALQAHAPTAGPAVTFSALIPDLHHYKGPFGGRMFPLWADREHWTPNVKAGLLDEVTEAFEVAVGAPELMAYFAAVVAHLAYTARFRGNSMEPELRDGDRIVADISRQLPATGEAFVLWDGIGLVVKHVEGVRGDAVDDDEPPRLRLISANPDYAPYSCLVQDVHILGKVAWVVRRM